jgi:thiol-disulfide isomerase/thioredoxin
MHEGWRLALIRTLVVIVTALALGPSPGAGPPGYFPCPVILFFAPCLTVERVGEPVTAGSEEMARPILAPGEVDSSRIESLWAEPSPGPPATGPMYVPPTPVREFLEAPTAERARAYLAWNQARLRAIARATEVLRLITGSEKTGTDDSPAQVTSGPTAGCAAPATNAGGALPAAGGVDPLAGVPGVVADSRRVSHGISVLYAFASWCPYSARQTPLVAAWARSRPDVPVTGWLLDSPPGAAAQLDGLPFPVHAGSPALRERLQVRSYPTLLVVKDGMPVERLAGLTPVARLEAVIRALGA